MSYPVPPQRRRPQPPLFPDAFDRPVMTVGALRGVVGRFFEAATSSLLALPSLSTDSRCPLCPDFATESGDVFHEVKATGSRKVLIYETALRKYQDAAAAGVEVVHWVWSYKLAEWPAVRLESNCFAAMAASGVEVWAVPLDVLTRAIADVPRVLLNSGVRSSAGRTGYGWDLPLTRVIYGGLSHDRRHSIAFGGVRLDAFTVRDFGACSRHIRGGGV